ncbi:hypothetical protein [Alienimonas californiensis]|uniref:Uncharacterized protein n=1 Tax=Alienimonas californiensis TaxID=2527989 RepID=A0A517PF98_9PLAN|nr:hypothetical protein [Alienimonas californiensis]QDT18053.1 hypothetical protein CA12_41920 [Alienimonas californiensis]
MPRLLPPLSSSSPRAARAAWRRLAVAVVLGCGLTITAGGCGATRQKVMRPVTGAIRSVPGMNRIVPHAGPPAPTTPPPPPPTIAAPHPEASMPSHRWEPGTGDPFSAPRDYNSSPPLPAPPNPLPGGARRPMLIGPPTDSSPSDRSAPNFNESAAPPPAPAPADPSAYYPVGRGRVRESVSSLWRRISSPLLGGSEEAAETKLVSHEAAEDEEARDGGRFSDSLIRLGRPTVAAGAADGEK